MIEFFSKLFSSEFMPHGHCYLWQPEILWLHVVSDATIAIAYYSIPVALLYFVRRRTDLAFNWIFVLFAAFIFACGSTHLLEIWTVWQGSYRIQGVVKLATAIVSVATAIILWPLIPQALRIPSRKDLEEAYENLEELVQARTKQLDEANSLLQEQVQDLRAAEELFRLSVESSPSGMVLVGEDGKIELANEEAEVLFGYTKGELLGQPIEHLLPFRYREHHPELRLAFFQSPQKRQMGNAMELHALRKDHSEFRVQIGLNPISLGGKHYVLSSIIDVTERVRVREELKAQNDELQQLMYIVSHDLKSPLVTIQGFSGLLQEAIEESDLEEAKDSSARISRATESMASLIDELLELSRITRNRLNLQQISIAEIVGEVLESLESQITTSQAHIIIQEPLPSFHCDKYLLIQVFQNLISNAMKYGTRGPGSPIHIGVEEEPTKWKLYVRDQGKGIAKEHQERVFQLFHRLDNDGDGSGIGLAIVAKVSRLLGGKAWIESEINKGATFLVTISKNIENDNLKDPTHG